MDDLDENSAALSVAVRELDFDKVDDLLIEREKIARDQCEGIRKSLRSLLGEDGNREPG